MVMYRMFDSFNQREFRDYLTLTESKEYLRKNK